MSLPLMRALKLRTCLALFVTLAPLTWCASRIYPGFDDAGNEILLKENGPNAIRHSLPDRPLVGWLGNQLMYSSHRVALGITLQFAGWFLFGLTAALIWLELFPEHPSYAPVSAALSVAPILLKAQLATAMFVLPVNFSVIPVLTAGLLLARYVRSTIKRPALAVACAMLLTFAGSIMTEYGLLTSATISILLVTLNWKNEQASRGRLFLSIAVLSGSALLAHLIYGRIAVAHPEFSGVTFTPPAKEVIAHWRVYGDRLLRAFFYSSVGAWAQGIGRMAAQTAKGTTTLLATLYTLAAGFIIAFCCRSTSGNPEIPARTWWRTAAALILTITVALAPACLLAPLLVGRDLHMEYLSTRYYFVAAPFAIALGIRLLLELTRPQFRFALVLGIGLLAGDAVAEHSREAYDYTRAMRQVGPLVEKYVRGSDKQTVILTSEFYARDPEATYKATAALPAELSRRVWVMWEKRVPVVLGHTSAESGRDCENPAVIDRNMRTIIRKGEVGQLLWLQPTPGGGFRVEPYCLPGTVTPVTAIAAR